VNETYPGTSGIADQAGIWSAIVQIGGTDWSARVVGDIQIDAEEGGARVADLSVRPLAGSAFVLADWVGTDLSIDIADLSSGSPTSITRLFTGVIDTPTLDLKTGILALRCTDDLQNSVDAMTVAAIDAAIPGGYSSPVVFDPAARGWAHAQDLLSTIPASLDLDPAGTLRLTDWEPKPTPDLSFTEDHLLDGSLGLSLSSRHQLINHVTIDFGFRFPRVKAEGYHLSFEYVDVSTFAAYVENENLFLQRQAVEAAIHAAGATIDEITYIPMPDEILHVAEVALWAPGKYDMLLCMGFDADVSFNYGQTIEEHFVITVSAPNSIAAVGTLRDRLSGALEGIYPPVQTAEHSIIMHGNALSGIPPLDQAAPTTGATTSVDVTLTEDTDRTAANTAMEALIQIAKTKIWGSHRRNFVSAAVALNPAVDLDATIDLEVTGLHARGKCVRVSHRLSPETGAATSDFSIALCAVAGTGTSHPDTETAAPEGTTPATSPLIGTPTIVFHGGKTEDQTLVITFPGVADAERNRHVVEISSAFSAGIVEDILEIEL